ncbi:MAG: beta-hydroxyacyl-ACP dehydratase [Phycisphaerales bacterium]|nr:beta-hydroxyacyl-ACP dehydratase [Phycisphaerales bacterium]
MPPPALIQPSTLDFSNLYADQETVLRAIPQRHEFLLLNGIVLFDAAAQLMVGFHDVKSDAYWTRGHIPGRPVFPGVLMIETAAQLCSAFFRTLLGGEGFLGFAGVEGVKFRGAVVPPARFVVAAVAKSVRPRRMVCTCQGFVGDDLVFEGEIAGMPI